LLGRLDTYGVGRGAPGRPLLEQRPQHLLERDEPLVEAGSIAVFAKLNRRHG